MSRGLAPPRSKTRSELEAVLGQAFRSERPSGGGPELEVRPSGQRGGPELEAGAVSSRPGLLVEDWIALLCRF